MQNFDQTKAEMTGLRILFFGQYYRMGGTRTYFKQLLDLYSKQGAHVIIIRTFADDNPEINELAVKYGFTVIETLKDKGAKDSSTRLPGHIIREWLTYRRLVRNLSPDILVVSVGTPKLFAGVLPLAKRSLYILHTSPRIAESEPKWKQMIIRHTYGLFFGKRSWIVTVSKNTMDSIAIAWAAPKNALHLVHSTMGNIVQSDKSNQSKRRVVLTLGHVVQYKNPFNWINVAKNVLLFPQFSDVKFIWVGEGELLEDCRKAVSAEGLEHALEFVGLKQDVEPHYKTCTIYFQPSYMESLGLSVLDAMRHGRPCVVSNRGGLPEVIDQGVSGWIVDPEDITHMTDKICKLLSDEKLQAKMGEAAQLAYANTFNSHIWERKMTDIHLAIMQNNPIK